MTNQQGAPEALRPIARYKIGYHTDEWGMRSSTPSGIPDHAGTWVRYEDHVAALVEAQQPAPSAAVALSDDLRDGLVAISAAIADQDDRAAQAMLREILAAPQPSPTPQADSQPAPQGETNAQLDIDSNHSAPGQQWDVAGPVALGQPMGDGPDQAAGHLSAQGDKLLTVAERNIRSFLRSAVFKSESDREAALNCVDVLWGAASAPADSVTAPAATPAAASIAWNALRDATDPLGETGTRIMGLVRVFAQRQYEAGLAEGRATSPAQAADSVLEDAARLLRQILTASQDGDSDTHLSAHFVSRIETITNPGGAA